MTTYPPELEVTVHQWIKTQLPTDRLNHIYGVVSIASELAAHYAPDEVSRARLAAWLHDAAKTWNDAALLTYAGQHGMQISLTERMVPMLLHGAVGCALAEDRFGLDDPALREACALHSTGAPGMSLLAKIIFVADMIEPERTFSGVEDLRLEATRDLDAAVLGAAGYKLRHLIRRQRVIDTRTVALYNALLTAGVRYSH